MTRPLPYELCKTVLSIPPYSPPLSIESECGAMTRIWPHSTIWNKWGYKTCTEMGPELLYKLVYITKLGLAELSG